MNIFKRLFNQTESTMQPSIISFTPDDPESKDSPLGTVQQPTEEPVTLPKKQEAPVTLPQKQEAPVYTISYGTHMAIDAIYAYLDKDFEERGYNDAMCCIDIAFKQSGERIIRDELKMLFRRVTLRYMEDQRKLATTMHTVKQLGMLTQASAIESKMETINEHLEEIKRMEIDFDNNESSMMRPIESYSRGFQKGIAAKTSSLLN